MVTIFIVTVTAVLIWVAFAYNRLMRLGNQVDAAWSDIDVQLQRRHDLVPRLVSATRAYARHEREALESVTELRARALRLTSPSELGAVESALEEALDKLLALREAYPELQANRNFLQLQRELVEIEDHLQYARRFYNGAVRDYNTTIERVPDVLVARLFGFRGREYFQAGEDARTSIPTSAAS